MEYEKDVPSAASRFCYSNSAAVEWRAHRPYSEVSEVLCIVVELNPANDAVILHVLRNLGLVNAKMLGQLLLQSSVRKSPASADAFAAARATGEIPQAHA